MPVVCPARAHTCLPFLINTPPPINCHTGMRMEGSLNCIHSHLTHLYKEGRNLKRETALFLLLLPALYRCLICILVRGQGVLERTPPPSICISSTDIHSSSFFFIASLHRKRLICLEQLVCVDPHPHPPPRFMGRM